MDTIMIWVNSWTLHGKIWKKSELPN
jgi:hypothetical protein